MDEELNGYIERKMREEKHFVKRLDQYGLSKIPAGALKELDLEDREHFIRNSKMLFHYDARFIA